MSPFSNNNEDHFLPFICEQVLDQQDGNSLSDKKIWIKLKEIKISFRATLRTDHQRVLFSVL